MMGHLKMKPLSQKSLGLRGTLTYLPEALQLGISDHFVLFFECLGLNVLSFLCV